VAPQWDVEIDVDQSSAAAFVAGGDDAGLKTPKQRPEASADVDIPDAPIIAQ
jgi:hypothetical protein